MVPSRKILHARGRGSDRRKSETRPVGPLGVLGATRRIKINSAISISGRSQDPSWRRPVSVWTILSFSSDVFKKCTKIACFAPLRFKMLRRLVLKIALLSLLRSPSLRHCGLKCLIKLDRTLIKSKRNLIKNHLREVGTLPEDTSRGVEAVKVPETRNAGRRYSGHLGDEQTNQVSSAYELLELLLRPLFLAPHPRIVMYYR